MALIKLGGLAQDVRGSQNGLTFSRNKGGAYVRQKVSPVQPRTPAQLLMRDIFAVNAKAWSGTLTAGQRAAWTAFAAANPLTNVFGDSIVTSGLAAFSGLNSVLGLLAGTSGATELDPPIDKSVTPQAMVTGITASSAGAGTFELNTAAQAVPNDSQYYVFATPSLAVGKTPPKSDYRFIGAKPMVAAAVVVNLSTLYVAKYGIPLAGKNVWAIVAFVNTTSGAVTVGQKFFTNVG